MLNTIDQFWKNTMQSCPAIAHQLKHTFNERWVRFHTLPNGKRYACTSQEYEEIRHRQQQLLNATTNGQVYVVLTEGSWEPKTKGLSEPLLQLFPNAEYWRSKLYEPEHNLYWHLYAEQVNLTSIELETVLNLVADDEIRNVMLIAPETETLIHPYDGGIDIIASNQSHVNLLKNRFPDWLSQHPDGL